MGCFRCNTTFWLSVIDPSHRRVEYPSDCCIRPLPTVKARPDLRNERRLTATCVGWHKSQHHPDTVRTPQPPPPPIKSYQVITNPDPEMQAAEWFSQWPLSEFLIAFCSWRTWSVEPRAMALANWRWGSYRTGLRGRNIPYSSPCA